MRVRVEAVPAVARGATRSITPESDAAGAPEAAEAGEARGEVAVVGVGDAATLAQVGQIGVEAVQAVAREWHRPWSHRLLVVVPADRAQWHAVAGTDPGTGTTGTGTGTGTDGGLGSSAAAGASTGKGAATQGPAAARNGVAPAMTVSAPDGSAYVVLDPHAWATASSPGRRALLIHEAVHVAVWADPQTARHSAPAWLAEGFAQFVAYGQIGADVHLIAPELLDRVRREGPPVELPTDEQLALEGPQRLDGYAQAWLACLTLADLAGPTAPAEAMAAGGPDRPGGPGVATAKLRGAWQADLVRLAGSGPS